MDCNWIKRGAVSNVNLRQLLFLLLIHMGIMIGIAVQCGRYSLVVFEKMDKCVWLGEAEKIGDFLDGIAGIGKVIFCLGNKKSIDEGLKRDAVFLAHKAG